LDKIFFLIENNAQINGNDIDLITERLDEINEEVSRKNKLFKRHMIGIAAKTKEIDNIRKCICNVEDLKKVLLKYYKALKRNSNVPEEVIVKSKKYCNRAMLNSRLFVLNGFLLPSYNRRIENTKRELQLEDNVNKAKRRKKDLSRN